MTQIESKKVTVSASTESVFDFLSDMNNIQKLLPLDKITEWKSDEKSCSFKIQNAYTIGLNHMGGTPHSTVNYESAQGSPFAFTLNTQLSVNDNGTDAQLFCEADINPFLKMIVTGPLKNLFDYMAERLVKLFVEQSA
ncbi:MAG: hypothetical protein ACKVOR_06665 [Flavobacteriales bacterium]